MADATLAGLVNVLSASQAGVNGNPVGTPQLQQIAQRLAGWSNQPGVPVQMHGLPASFMDHLNSGGTRTYPSGGLGLGAGGTTPIGSVVNPGLGTGGVAQSETVNPTPPLPKYQGGFGPGAGSSAPNLQWYGGTENSMNGTVAMNPTQNTYNPQTFEHELKPADDKFKDYYVPWPWQGKPLPGGAFKSLFPTQTGNEWSKVKPYGWDELGAAWRPFDITWKDGVGYVNGVPKY